MKVPIDLRQLQRNRSVASRSHTPNRTSSGTHRRGSTRPRTRKPSSVAPRIHTELHTRRRQGNLSPPIRTRARPPRTPNRATPSATVRIACHLSNAAPSVRSLG